MRRLRDPLLRFAFRYGYWLARAYWIVVRPEKKGVKCVLTRDREILLVRHTYGRPQWDLPGGGIKRGEEPREAATREIREELGLDLEDWRLLGDLFARVDGKRDRLWCFAHHVGDSRLELDRAEIAEVAWFRRDLLPEVTTHYVPRIIAMSS